MSEAETVFMEQETTITIVQAPACHFCADADQILSDLADRYPVQLIRLDMRTSEGLLLTQQHRAAMSPLVLVDGQFFSQGRLPRGKVRQLTSALDRAATATRGAL
jgi:glutaredoxin